MLPFDASADPFEECIAQLKALPIEIGPNSKLDMLERSSQAIVAAACAVYQQQHGKEVRLLMQSSLFVPLSSLLSLFVSLYLSFCPSTSSFYLSLYMRSLIVIVCI